ncbi:hypothetical protein IT157_08140 [bacterium]|nr:hypothetical protein [bacterium]
MSLSFLPSSGNGSSFSSHARSSAGVPVWPVATYCRPFALVVMHECRASEKKSYAVEVF